MVYLWIERSKSKYAFAPRMLAASIADLAIGCKLCKAEVAWVWHYNAFPVVTRSRMSGERLFYMIHAAVCVPSSPVEHVLTTCFNLHAGQQSNRKYLCGFIQLNAYYAVEPHEIA